MNKQKLIAIILLGFLLYSCTPESKSKVSVDKNQEDQSKYTIGAVLPLSGKNAEYGLWIKQSLELARGEINTYGGIKMANLTILYEDDQCSPTTAATAMQKLVEVDHVPIVFGSWCSSSALAMAPIAESHQVIMMAEAMSPKIRDSGDFVFRIQPDASKYAVELAQYAEKKGYNHPAILGVDNEFGRGYADSFADAFMGGISKKSIPKEYYDASTTDFRLMLQKLAYQHNGVDNPNVPDVFVVPAYTEISLIIKQMNELNISIPLLAAPPFENQDILNAVGDLANGIVYPHHFDPEDPIAREFELAYTKKYGSSAEGYAALAYDGLFVLAKAMQTCDHDTACIRDELYRLSYSGVTGMTSFDDHGDVTKPIIMKIVSNGSFVRLR